MKHLPRRTFLRGIGASISGCDVAGVRFGACLCAADAVFLLRV
jgi:hypothetical protein